MTGKAVAAAVGARWVAIRESLKPRPHDPDLLLVLGQLGIGAAILDARGAVLRSNATLDQLLGVVSTSGSRLLELIATAEVEKKPPSPHSGFFTTEFVSDDGISVSLLLMLKSMPGEHFLITAQRREQRSEVDTQNREAERLHREFISIVSHEIRTPLASMLGGLTLLASGRAGTIPASAQRMLQIAHESSQRLVRLVNDLLDIDKLESGEMTFYFEEICAQDAMLKAANAMRHEAEDLDLRIEVRGDRPRIIADLDRLVHVLTNLLSNALKFSVAGTTVHLSCEVRETHALFTVSDEGRGIPAEKLPHIFDKFSQVEIADGSRKGGTGLGLAICRNIVERQQGRIWAESRPGKGTTFYFSLPLAQPHPCETCCDESPGHHPWQELSAPRSLPSLQRSLPR